MFRGPSFGGRSKATASTLCQKCLKRDTYHYFSSLLLYTDSLPRHYSYECKATAQERPYAARPSRTQQLLNPKLAPKLMTDVPNDLLRKKGVADEELAKKEAERGRKHDRNDDDSSIQPRKRSRSVSSYSSSSVSTISTNLSRSRSPSPRRTNHLSPDKPMISPRKAGTDRKRRRRSFSSSSDSYTSDSSYDAKAPKGGDRNTRRRLSSFSPAARGRRRSRSSVSSRMETSKSRSPVRNSGRRPRSPSLDRMGSRSRSRGRRPKSGLSRRMSLSRSHSGGRRGRSSLAKGMTKSRSRSRSPSRGKRAGISRSRSPLRSTRRRSPLSRRSRSRRRSPYRSKNTPHGGDRNGMRDGAQGQPRDDRRPPKVTGSGQGALPPVRKDRSLSPYSKRLALTQAMSMGGR
ncbi:hypothetical protein K432DRAFT_391719 [Lepidopterella palustris CBS 459.81]|uniref:Uncharacterized protein n=1 Tax=Lepidopterella palustris CBS 459.81 TaxID=1314670 RepID=A0A8E2JH92_9PEZI|nr:hypothetical protein K432DRAFT_391719 [Lepidopterella palustris CBS 459.81]